MDIPIKSDAVKMTNALVFQYLCSVPGFRATATFFNNQHFAIHKESIDLGALDSVHCCDLLTMVNKEIDLQTSAVMTERYCDGNTRNVAANSSGSSHQS